jgi:beta-phosphoglucomutase-like phosphatase (HAD superfamily)
MISKIYLDMDGVIADFNKRYKEIYGMLPKEAERHKKFENLFRDAIKNNIFADLDPMPGAMDLIEYLRKASVPTQILSSTARPEVHDEVAKQKMIWLQKHGITFNPIFVPGKRLKKQYAAPDSLIIDDTEVVIDDWVGAGGCAIWHKDVPSTINILKLVYKI